MTNLRTITRSLWDKFRQFTIQADFLGARLNWMNSFISIFSIKIGRGDTRYLFFFSYDPIGIRLFVLFLDFTPGYFQKAQVFAANLRKIQDELYMKSFEKNKK